MARTQTRDLQVERNATQQETGSVVGGGGCGYGGYGGYGGGYGGYGGGFGGGYGRGYGGYQPAHTWHNTSHYDYHGPSIRRHGNHLHVTPGHFDLHRTGHWHHNHR